MTSYIYFIQAQGDGPIKIGVTQFNPLRRMVKIQSDCPWPVELLGTIVGTVAQEKRIHMLLACYRTQGEWFSPHPIVLAAIGEAIRVGVPAEFKKRRGAKHDHPLCLYRAAHNLTVHDIAARTGLTACTISRFETRKNKPNGESLKALIRATGLTVIDLRPDLVEFMAEVAA